MINPKFQSSEQGFTLLEVLIVLGISVVMLMGLLNLFEWHQKVYAQEVAHVRTTGAVRSTMLQMSEDVAQAVAIETTHTFSGTTYTSTNNTIVLRLPAVDSSDNVIASTYDYVVYYLSDGSLYQKVDPGTNSARGAVSKLIAENIDIFDLTYDNATVTFASYVTIDIQATIPTRNNNVSTRIIDTIFLRNKIL
jgi:prepilin-type N-terminal cleavage/methylation domain-containing protein